MDRLSLEYRISQVRRSLRERARRRFDDEDWVTINGTHVLLNENGEAVSGGKLKGKKFTRAKTIKKTGRASSILGKNSKIPTKDEIKMGTATYGGLPVLYKQMDADARNVTTEIWVSDKFFGHSPDIQKHILNHEVAHNLSDEMMFQNSGRWQEFSGAFMQEKKVPETAPAYKEGQRTYWEGLYGDIGATALSETVTRAVTEYLDNPQGLKDRSAKAYEEVKKYVDDYVKKLKS